MATESEKFEQTVSGKEIIAGITFAIEVFQLFKNKGGEMKTTVASGYKEFEKNPTSVKDILTKTVANTFATVENFEIEREKEKMRLKAEAISGVMEVEAKFNELTELKKERASMESAASDYYKQAASRFSQERDSNDGEELLKERMRRWTEKIRQATEAKKNETKQRNSSFFASLFSKK